MRITSFHSLRSTTATGMTTFNSWYVDYSVLRDGNVTAVSSLVKFITIGTEGLGLIPGPVKSDTRHCYDVSSELCCPGAKLRR